MCDSRDKEGKGIRWGAGGSCRGPILTPPFRVDSVKVMSLREDLPLSLASRYESQRMCFTEWKLFSIWGGEKD